jgi:nitroreductase
MLKDVLEKRYTAKHWDYDKPIEQSKIDYIIDCAYLSPSKMAAHLHKIVVITDSIEGKKIKEWLYYGHTWHNNGKQGNEDSNAVTGFNGQYTAPVVIAWLNPIHGKENVIIEYNGVPTNVNLPNFGQRQNDIFLSSMCAVIAAEEQGLNTGFGSCHSHVDVAEKLGFPEYQCPIVVGIGYAKDMSSIEEKYGILIPIFDPTDPTRQIGVDSTNFQAWRNDNPNRNNTPPKESMIVTI